MSTNTHTHTPHTPHTPHNPHVCGNGHYFTVELHSYRMQNTYINARKRTNKKKIYNSRIGRQFHRMNKFIIIGKNRREKLCEIEAERMENKSWKILRRIKQSWSGSSGNQVWHRNERI